MFDYDPRDRDQDASCDFEAHWIKLGQGPSDDHAHDIREDARERADDPRDYDARDPFVHDLELPSGPERELVIDRDHRYELNGEDTRSLATVGTFRIVSEGDLGDPGREPDLRHLQDQGLVRFVSLDRRDRDVTLTERGHQLLEAPR